VAAKRIVLLDACVLYPAPLRDLLMHLLLAGLYQCRWLDAIHEEWINAVLEQRPDLNRSQLERTRQLMDRIGPDSLVSGYEDIAGKIRNLPDPGDAHVIAAAIKGKADTILTYNTKDFPSHILEPIGIKAMTPDAFVSELLKHQGVLVCSVMAKHRAMLKKPPKSEAEYLETLVQQRLVKSVQVIRESGGII
jgi:PIN domain